MSLTPLFTNIRPTIVWLLIATFSCCGLYVPQGHADVMPSPGVRVSLSPEFSPYLLNGIKIDPNNPLRFEFLMSQSDEGNQDQIKMQKEANKLIKYFLASITVPENDLWVNLSPYEKDKVIPSGFGETGMGRDLLAQDYLLKQITASLMYPEDDLGKKFWQEIYKQAVKAGVQNVPVNTFNKVWIVPEKAVVYENGAINAAFVGEARLKVMLEEDYLATNKFLATISESTHQSSRHLAKKSPQGASPSGALPLRADGSQSEIATKEIIRSIILPALEKEVNEGKNFATLRQVYNSLILASWYKKKIKNSLLSKAYANKNKVKGTEDESAKDPNEVYGQYLKAFKKGVYNLIKEETDPVTQ